MITCRLREQVSRILDLFLITLILKESRRELDSNLVMLDTGRICSSENWDLKLFCKTVTFSTLQLVSIFECPTSSSLLFHLYSMCFYEMAVLACHQSCFHFLNAFYYHWTVLYLGYNFILLTFSPFSLCSRNLARTLATLTRSSQRCRWN